MTFQEKIVKLRKIKGLTQDEFASAVGVSRQAVYKWESGQSYPEVAKLIEIKLLFNISIDDLLDESYEVIMPEKKKKKRLTKEAKAEIEARVRAEAALDDEEPEVITAAEAAPETAPEEAPVHEAPAASAAITEEAPAEEEPVAAAPEAAAAPAVEEAPALKEDETEKKRGFFSKLFGRK